MIKNCSVASWAALAALSLVVAGCADSGGGKSVESVPEPKISVDPSADPIVLGEASDITGVIKKFVGRNPVHDGIVAAVDYINDNGGVDGRPIKLDTCDVKGDPARGPVCAQQFIKDDVVGVVGFDSAWGASGLPQLEAAGIPNFTTPAGDAELTGALSFPLLGGSASDARAIAKYFSVEEGAQHVAVLYGDIAGGDQINKQYVEAFNGFGVDDVSSIAIKFPVADLTPTVVQAKESDPDVVICLCPAEQTLKAAAQVGLETKWVLPNGTLEKPFIDSVGSLADGTYQALSVGDYLDTGNEDAATVQDAMKRYLPGVEVQANTATGFATVMTLVNVMEAVGADKVDKTSLANFMKTVDGVPVFLGKELDSSAAPEGFPNVTDPYSQITRYENGQLEFLGWQNGWTE